MTDRAGKEANRMLALCIITIVSMGLVMMIRYIRSLRLSLSDWELFLQGTLPNFFAATGLWGVIFMWYKKFAVVKGFYTLRNTLMVTFLIVFSGLCAWEVMQLYIADAPMDVYDIMMSFIGCVLMSGLSIGMYRDEWRNSGTRRGRGRSLWNE